MPKDRRWRKRRNEPVLEQREPEGTDCLEDDDELVDDHPDDNLSMPPTVDEIESLPWDGLDLYLPSTTQEEDYQ